MNKSNIVINFSEEFGFSYELYFENGEPLNGLNNAFMFFKKNSRMLEQYLHHSYEALQKMSSNDAIERTIIGPSLLRSLNISSKNIIDGLNILNLNALLDICNSPQHNIPEYITKHINKKIGGANLCLNERSFFEDDLRSKYDQLLLAATNFLLQRYS
jgi:hypothetical protein